MFEYQTWWYVRKPLACKRLMFKFWQLFSLEAAKVPVLWVSGTSEMCRKYLSAWLFVVTFHKSQLRKLLWYFIRFIKCKVILNTLESYTILSMPVGPAFAVTVVSVQVYCSVWNERGNSYIGKANVHIAFISGTQLPRQRHFSLECNPFRPSYCVMTWWGIRAHLAARF
jgi:hypothetical protein